MTASIRIGGRRMPCQMCACHDAKYTFELEGHKTMVCRHCIRWLCAFNKHYHIPIFDKPAKVHIPHGTRWEEYPCKSVDSIPKIFDRYGRRYWYDLGMIQKCDGQMKFILEFWEKEE